MPIYFSNIFSVFPLILALLFKFVILKFFIFIDDIFVAFNNFFLFEFLGVWADAQSDIFFEFQEYLLI